LVGGGIGCPAGAGEFGGDGAAVEGAAGEDGESEAGEGGEAVVRGQEDGGGADVAVEGAGVVDRVEEVREVGGEGREGGGGQGGGGGGAGDGVADEVHAGADDEELADGGQAGIVEGFGALDAVADGAEGALGVLEVGVEVDEGNGLVGFQVGGAPEASPFGVAEVFVEAEAEGGGALDGNVRRGGGGWGGRG
jgi:hypothetical protein